LTYFLLGNGIGIRKEHDFQVYKIMYTDNIPVRLKTIQPCGYKNTQGLAELIEQETG